MEIFKYLLIVSTGYVALDWTLLKSTYFFKNKSDFYVYWQKSQLLGARATMLPHF